MKQSERLFALLLPGYLTLGMLTACGSSDGDTSSEGDGGSPAAARRADRLHGIPEPRGGLLLNAFEEATGIKVNALPLSTVRC